MSETSRLDPKGDIHAFPRVSRDRPLVHFALGYLLLSLSRFVGLHEVAHIGLAHGKPLSAFQKALDGLVDGKDPMEGDRSAAVRSQAKEIAAGSWALNAFLDLQDAEFGVNEPDPMRKILASKLMGTPRLRLRWSLLTAFLLFQIPRSPRLDVRERQAGEPTAALSTPPARSTE